VDTSDWLSGPGPNYAGTWRKSQRVPPDATSSLPHLGIFIFKNLFITPFKSSMKIPTMPENKGFLPGRGGLGYICEMSICV